MVKQSGLSLSQVESEIFSENTATTQSPVSAIVNKGKDDYEIKLK